MLKNLVDIVIPPLYNIKHEQESTNDIITHMIELSNLPSWMQGDRADIQPVKNHLMRCLNMDRPQTDLCFDLKY